MIDIETMDNAPTAAILSIGAARFDPGLGLIGPTFHQRTSLDDCIALGLTVSASTIAWWMQQADTARHSAFTDPLPLALVLRNLSSFLQPDDKVWANSPAFDLVILRNAYKAIGSDAPWSYRVERCTRTAYDLAGVDLDGFRQGTYHDAIDDAVSQARAVIEAYRCISFARR
jgi:hypothetical protein